MPLPTFEYETLLWQAGQPVVGVDEAGRGPLAGPVTAAAVVFPCNLEPSRLAGLNDSKKLSAKRRESLLGVIQSHALGWAVEHASVEEIDRLNIYQASRLAMARAMSKVWAQAPFGHALTDAMPFDAAAISRLPHPLGQRLEFLPANHQPLIKGDQKSLSIAAASVLAKQARDALMAALHEAHPKYGFDRHKGYPTPEHLAALKQWGPCPAHRRSYTPVAQLGLNM